MYMYIHVFVFVLTARPAYLIIDVFLSGANLLQCTSYLLLQLVQVDLRVRKLALDRVLVAVHLVIVRTPVLYSHTYKHNNNNNNNSEIENLKSTSNSSFPSHPDSLFSTVQQYM